MAQGLFGRVLRVSAYKHTRPSCRSKSQLKGVSQPSIPRYETVFRGVDFKNSPDVATFVRHGKLFENEHFISYNKPAGAKVFRNLENVREAQDDGDEPSIHDIMHLISREAGCDHVEICEAPHQSYSGVMILGKSRDACRMIKHIFEKARQRNEFLRADLALAVAVPTPRYGIISTSYKQKEVNGRSVLIPVFNPSNKQLKYGLVKPSRTTFRVLDDAHGIALVELWPRDEVPEQGLFHLTTKMCKVLGDTIYSSRIVTVRGVKMLVEPSLVDHGNQNLPSWLRRKLPGPFERLPLFMHRHVIKLPPTRALGLADGLKLSAPLPPHFVTMMQMLSLDMYGHHKKKKSDPSHDLNVGPE